MDMTDTLLDTILEPCSETWKDVNYFQQKTSDCPCDESLLNPKNRIDKLQSLNTYCRIDGCTNYGTRFLAVPINNDFGSTLLRADVYIPGQEHHPKYLRDYLQSSLSVCTSGPRTVELGIVHHIRNALDYHVRCYPGFLEDLQALPFGSKLVFDSVKADVREMALHVHPSYELERQFFTSRKLRELFSSDHSGQCWPPVVDLRELRLLRQLNDSISRVSIAGIDGHHIFKSTTADPMFLYHELKLLLSMPHHPNIIAPPRFLVTKQSVFGAKRGVCGFILQYHAGGCLRDVLPQKAARGSLGMDSKLKWARQITSALLHIQESAGQYYSDLRPDNVLLTDLSEDLVLIDFEQRGNWYSWTAPEVRYLCYLQKLCALNSSGNLASESQLRCLLRYEHIAPKINQGATSSLGLQTRLGQSSVWSAIPANCQTSAMVYSPGLLLFCIFEGVSCFRQNLATSFEFEPRLSCPDFRFTPENFRVCIRECVDLSFGLTDALHRCTRGSLNKENLLDPLDGKLVRHGAKITVRDPVAPSTNEVSSIKEIVSASW